MIVSALAGWLLAAAAAAAAATAAAAVLLLLPLPLAALPPLLLCTDGWSSSPLLPLPLAALQLVGTTYLCTVHRRSPPPRLMLLQPEGCA
jgi:hypothetical protein